MLFTIIIKTPIEPAIGNKTCNGLPCYEITDVLKMAQLINPSALSIASSVQGNQSGDDGI